MNCRYRKKGSGEEKKEDQRDEEMFVKVNYVTREKLIPCSLFVIDATRFSGAKAGQANSGLQPRFPPGRSSTFPYLVSS